MVGKVGKPYGILGWINIFSFTENPEKIFKYFPWFFLKEKRWIRIKLNNWKKNNNNFIININTISNRSEAAQFTNSDIIISRYTLPKLKKDEYYWNDIINYTVFNTRKFYLGEVIKLIRAKNNDILIIEKKILTSKKKILIPFIYKKIIQKINHGDKNIIVYWNHLTYLNSK